MPLICRTNPLVQFYPVSLHPMLVTIFPSRIHGRVSSNPSKSHAQRAIALAALARGTSILSGIGTSEDVLTALRIIENLGVKIAFNGNKIGITSGGDLARREWNCGESGLCLRLFSAIAGLYDHEITLKGRDTLLKRPVDFMTNPFHQLGVIFSSNAGFPPLKITGPYLLANASLEGSVSSQFLTGLLIALPVTMHDTTLYVNNLKSKPYIDLTIATLREFGGNVVHENYEVFHIKGNQHYRPVSLRIQGDWSGMAFLLVAAAITGEIEVTGLPHPDQQADGKILDILDRVGAIVAYSDELTSVRNNHLNAFEWDCTDCPDLVPPLVVLASCCTGTSIIRGIHRLKTKESDRGSVLVNEFQKLGLSIQSEGDTLLIKGGKMHGGITDAHGDHRIAMALAIAGLVATSVIEIIGAECVSKSYPDFFQDLEVLGARIEY